MKLLFFALAAGAFLLRLVDLDSPVVSPVEGPKALAAWQLANGKVPDWWEAPGLALSLAGSFIVFGDSEATARLLPALAGGGTLLALALFQPWLGWWPVVAATALAALSPSGLAVGRSVAEDSLAALVTLLMGCTLVRFWDQRPPFIAPLAGVGGGALVHLGYPGVTGALALLLFALAWSTIRPQRAWQATPAWLREALFPFGAAFVLISTGGLFYLDGFGVPSVAAWARHFEGLTGDQPWFQAPLVLAGYEPIALLIGLPAAVLVLRRWLRVPGDPGATLGAFLAVWALLGLLFLVLGGTADTSSVYVSALPLAVLAGWAVGRGLEQVDGDTLRRLAWGIPVVAGCCAFAGINILRAAAESPGNSVSPWLAAAALVLPLAAVPALAAESPRPVPMLAAYAGLGAVILSLHGIARLREPWPGEVAGQGLAAKAMNSFTLVRPYTPAGQGFHALVHQDLRPATGWYLRDLPSVTYAGRMARGPALLVGDAGSSPAQIAGYQRRTVPLAEGWSPREWGWGEAVRWIATGDIPARSKTSRRAAVYVSTEGPPA